MPTASAIFYIRLLKDKNPNVRVKAAQTLGQLKNKPSLFALEDAERQETDECVKAAIQAVIKELEAL